MKLLPYSCILTALILTTPVFGDEKRGPFVESPRVLQTPAMDSDTMIKQIDLKVVLEQYEKLMTERLQAELQLDLSQIGADADADAEQRQLEHDVEAAGSEEEKKSAMDRLKEKQVRARERLKGKIEILAERCAMMRKEATVLADYLRDLEKRTTPNETGAAGK